MAEPNIFRRKLLVFHYFTIAVRYIYSRTKKNLAFLGVILLHFAPFRRRRGGCDVSPNRRQRRPCSRRGLVGGPSPSLPWRPPRPRRRRPPGRRRRRPGGGRPGGRGRRPCERKLVRLGKKNSPVYSAPQASLLVVSSSARRHLVRLGRFREVPAGDVPAHEVVRDAALDLRQ